MAYAMAQKGAAVATDDEVATRLEEIYRSTYQASSGGKWPLRRSSSSSSSTELREFGVSGQTSSRRRIPRRSRRKTGSRPSTAALPGTDSRVLAFLLGCFG